MPTLKNTFRHVDDNLKSSIMQNRGGQQVIERIIAAYGFESRQALCNHLSISQSTMANRHARDTFPADWVVIRGMENGVSIEWLSLGISTNASGSIQKDTLETPKRFESTKEDSSNPIEDPIGNTLNFDQGGKAAIERLVEAYGLKTRQALAEHLDVSKSTLANRYMRDTFPADWIIRCSLEAGAFIEWLSFGLGSDFPSPIKGKTARLQENISTEVVKLNQKKIIDGILYHEEECILDRSLLMKSLKKSLVVRDANKSYLVDECFTEIIDGKWIVEIEGKVSTKDLIRVRVWKVLVSSWNPSISFECMIDDLKAIACCKFYLIAEIS